MPASGGGALRALRLNRTVDTPGSRSTRLGIARDAGLRRALFAVADALPEVVRGSLTGSVVSNLLLVLGLALIAGDDHERLDRSSLFPQLGLVGIAVLLFLVPAVPGFERDPERHSLAVATAPVAAILLV